eukprot:10212503-Alexandrium_andersonii.AAC.1
MGGTQAATQQSVGVTTSPNRRTLVGPAPRAPGERQHNQLRAGPGEAGRTWKWAHSRKEHPT